MLACAPSFLSYIVVDIPYKRYARHHTLEYMYAYRTTMTMPERGTRKHNIVVLVVGVFGALSDSDLRRARARALEQVTQAAYNDTLTAHSSAPQTHTHTHERLIVMTLLCKFCRKMACRFHVSYASRRDTSA